MKLLPSDMSPVPAGTNRRAAKKRPVAGPVLPQPIGDQSAQTQRAAKKSFTDREEREGEPFGLYLHFLSLYLLAYAPFSLSTISSLNSFSLLTTCLPFSTLPPRCGLLKLFS